MESYSLLPNPSEELGILSYSQDRVRELLMSTRKTHLMNFLTRGISGGSIQIKLHLCTSY